MSKYNIHNDFVKYEKTKLPLIPLILPIIEKAMMKMFDNESMSDGVKETKVSISGYEGGNLPLSIYEPEKSSVQLPCLVYFHGGAFALRAAPYHKKLLCEYALRTPCKVVFVDYRLAPKHRFPVGVEDCYSAFEWVGNNAETLGIDKTKIAVAGDSAGGALAAAVCLMARDRNAMSICFQMLIYPVTDERQRTESMKNYVDTPMWNAKLNHKMWKLYLQDGVTSNKEYASPIEADSHKDLPPAYVEVAEFDCLHDEGLAYAKTLKSSGVAVEIYESARTVHGFEIAQESEVVRQIMNKRVQVLVKTFGV